MTSSRASAGVRQPPLPSGFGRVDLVAAMTGPICVASSGPMEKIRLSLSLTGLLPFFEGRIFSSYDLGCWKPDPGLFVHAAHVMGVAPNHCAVVEDSLPGVRAGLAAGMTVYALLSPGFDDSVLPDGVVKVTRLADLRRLPTFSTGPR